MGSEKAQPETDGNAMDRLWTYEDLQARWGVGARQVRTICQKLGLKPVDLGYRLKRFRPQSAMNAEERSENGGKRNTGALFGDGSRR